MRWILESIPVPGAIADSLAINIVLAFEVDRKSTRLNSSHMSTSYAVFCLKKKKRVDRPRRRSLRAPGRPARARPCRAARAQACRQRTVCRAARRRPDRRTRRAAVADARRAGRAQCQCGRAARGGPGIRSPLFFFNDTATTEIYTLSLHDALPI